jgi:hypothetical protein
VAVRHYEVEQPGSVWELTARLFPAYQVDGGRVYLAGCQWEDRLFVRVQGQQNGRDEEIWIDDHGELVPPEQIEQLGLPESRPLQTPPPYAPALFQRAMEQARLRAAAIFGQANDAWAEEITAVWCKFVEGKLRFTIGSASADLAFSGWARLLQAPPFICPHTGRTTFHLAATDDGRILDAAAIGVCEVSGRRLPVDELVRCSWTGKRTAKDFVDFCSLTGQPVLRSELAACQMCQEKVSPAVLQEGLCSACRSLRPASKADPRMARLLAEYPTLDRWHRWELAETETVYVLVASGLWKKLLVVVDKESLELRHLATRHRLQTHWRPVEPGQYTFVLRE